MEKDEKILALIDFLDFDEADYDRFEQSDYNPNIYIIDKGKEVKSCYKNNEFLICTNEEAEKEYEDSFMNLVDDLGIQSFTKDAQEYILENCVINDRTTLFDDAFDELTRSYAEDINLENNSPIMWHGVEVINRLLQECIENDIITTDDISPDEIVDGDYEGKDVDLVERYCEHFCDATTLGYDSAADWYKFEFGEQDFNQFVINHDIIDWDKVMEYCKDMDGRGNELNRWDGHEYEEEVNGTTYYIYPDCDFKELVSVKEDIEKE